MMWTVILFGVLLIVCGVGLGWLWWRAPYLALMARVRWHLLEFNGLDEVERRDYALAVMRNWQNQ